MERKMQTTGRVESVCVGARRGHPKQVVARAWLEENWGIARDIHAGIWPRQISLLAGEILDACRGKAKTVDIAPGACGENILTRGLEFSTLRIGDHLEIGEVALEITEVGRGALKLILARVLHGGEVAPGSLITSKKRQQSFAISKRLQTTPAECHLLY